MKRPIEVDAETLVTALAQLGYRPSCRTEGHIRLTCNAPATESVTVPDHAPIQPRTLEAILANVAPRHRMNADELAGRLFG